MLRRSLSAKGKFARFADEPPSYGLMAYSEVVDSCRPPFSFIRNVRLILQRAETGTALRSEYNLVAPPAGFTAGNLAGYRYHMPLPSKGPMDPQTKSEPSPGDTRARLHEPLGATRIPIGCPWHQHKRKSNSHMEKLTRSQVAPQVYLTAFVANTKKISEVIAPRNRIL